MSSNYNFNRHNSVGGNWHLPPPQGFSGDPDHPDGSYPNQQPPGFRNPWYSPTQPAQGLPQASLSQSPTKTLPLLQQQSKRMSFANHLATTYEDDRRQTLVPSIHPPTRADNPFDRYYTNQEVLLAGPDRRMSAAVDNLFYQNQQPYPATNAPALYQTPYLQNSRRLSVLVGGTYDGRPIYNMPATGRPPRSPSASHFSQFQRTPPPKRRPAPRAVKIYNRLDLKPKFHRQPKYRRCLVNSIHISPVNALTVYLTESYAICQPKKFQYSKETNPKRVLTKPSEPKFNNGFDNEDGDYILYVNDILGTQEGRKYIVLDLLGSGTFGQVVKCQNLANQSVVAVKVIKAKPAYLNQSLTEVRLLEFLNQNSRGNNFIKLLDTFMHKEHLCLVFELLASNLYELVKQNQFHGLSMKLVKVLTKQLLESVAQLKNFQMIHCDLKPENILLCQPDKPDIKVIDFGLACYTRQTVYTYIQSRFYRSPEVILGLPYTESIDMWSLGCIVGELFLGLPLFPGASEFNQIWRIVDMLGNPPRHMIEVGRNSMKFFKKIPGASPSFKPTYQLKTYEEYVQHLAAKGKDYPETEPKNTTYFKDRHLRDIIMNYKMASRKMTNSMIEKENSDRRHLVDFLQKTLNLNPLERMTPQEALKHPFVCDVVLE